MDYREQSRDYRRIESALLFLEQHRRRQPSLDETARAIGLSPSHFQRLFAQWAGVSPKRFLQFLTKERAKALLARAQSVLDVAYESGLSGPGRLHDLFVQCDAMTPGEYKSLGEGLIIRYGFHPTPFGDCLLAATDRGICHLAFVQEGDRRASLQGLAMEWSRADLVEKPAYMRQFLDRLFDPKLAPRAPLPLLLKGTNFQIKVWEALLRIPPGAAVSYERIARAIGRPHAARAVGSAVGANPIAFVIPCHRVIHKIGELGDYRWGRVRKQAMLGWEAAKLIPDEIRLIGGDRRKGSAGSDL